MSARSRSLFVTAALAAAVLAGCGAGGNGGGAPATAAGASPSSAAIPAVQKDAALAAMVPADVAADGKIVVGSDASYAPNEFVDADGTTIIGMDVDLGKAVAQKLGLSAEFQNGAFDGIMPGITSKKYEMGMSSFTDNADREKQVDMVTYFSAGTKWATLKGNPDGINVDDLCGKTVAVQRGTVQVDDITARNDKCTQARQARHQHLPVPGPDRRHAVADRQARAGHARRLPGRRLRGGADQRAAARRAAPRTTPRRTGSPCPRATATTARPSRARCRR